MTWYVAQVQSGREGDVEHKLARKGYSVRIPRERRSIHRRGAWQDVEVILMPGYVFIGTPELTDKGYYEIRRTPYIIRILGEPTPLSGREAAFWCLDGGDDPLQPSVLTLDREGRPTVMNGPLMGREADIVWVNRRQRRAGVRMHTPEGEKIFKFSVMVTELSLPPGMAGQETGRKAGSIHSPAARPADINGRPGGV